MNFTDDTGKSFPNFALQINFQEGFSVYKFDFFFASFQRKRELIKLSCKKQGEVEWKYNFTKKHNNLCWY